MGLEKAIASGKEKRKPYFKSKAFDPSCRNHKGCPRCVGNRLNQFTKSIQKCINQEKELL